MITKTASLLKRVIFFCLFVPCLGVRTQVYAQEIPRYDETVTLGQDGSAAIRLFLAVADWNEPRILIPVRHASLLDLRAPGFPPTAVRVLENKGNHFVALDFAGPGTRPTTIEISFRVKNYFAGGGRPGPFGNKDLGYRFVNVTFALIGKFSAELVLPAGYIFNAIGEFSPTPEKSGMAMPYTISRKNGKNIARMAVDNVKLGDEITYHCTFKSTKKSQPLLFALIALAIAYLFLFRDLLKSGESVAGKMP
jgi:hypothetical protein